MAGAERYVELEVRRAVHLTVVAAVAHCEGCYVRRLSFSAGPGTVVETFFFPGMCRA